ncbi:cadmium resistance transporter [Pseudonocardia spinosispora]|uniref:cadmium resistance transporter n=1 Tax=Pseudonocardia spinosispora TaxID=103441 RepID=UPI00040BD1B1|nr:cadmium resistance transporter [Pseudonocardia spinosispora]
MRTLAQAAVTFAVTNIDDLVVLALFFGRAGANGTAAMRVVAGQYLGFVAILVASVAGALGAGLLPAGAIPYLGLIPLLLGLRAAWTAWREHRSRTRVEHEAGQEPARRVGVWEVAAVTVANGGDNVGVYVPVFAVAGVEGLTVYLIVFLLGTGLWCAAGRYFATRPLIAPALAGWGHVVLPVVLVTIGLLILIDGHAFGAVGGA